MTQQDCSRYGEDIFRYGNLQPAHTEWKALRRTKIVLSLIFLSSLLAIAFKAGETTGLSARPLKHIYVFVPLAQQSRVLSWMTLAEVPVDSIEALYREINGRKK
jgi:hypothetical protein